MTLFLISFFIIYGGINAYVFFKAKSAISFQVQTGISIMLFMAFMVISPLLIRFFEKAGQETPAKVIAHVGYIWLGIIFLFFSCSIAIDLYRFIIFSAGTLTRTDLSSVAVSSRYAFFLPLAFSLIVSVYGFFEARDIRTERLIVKTAKIPPETKKFRIAQISDVHLGLIVGEDRLLKILEAVRAEAPDLLVSTGDLVDGQICNLNGLSDLFRKITPKYGKFAVTGNHEFYAGFEQAKCFTENAGFTLLRGEGVTLGGAITIAGVDDPTGETTGHALAVKEKTLLSSLPHEKFILFLKHRPHIDRNSEGLFDLQLSGHVHKGQIFPFSLITKLYYPVHAGFVSLSGGSNLYVSRGSGTWGPPIRFLSPPEVTIIELVNNNK